jgi:hypothetical protein
MVDQERDRLYYGHASLEPQGQIEAGSNATFRLTYTVGRYGIDDGGTLKIAVRFASDWGYPQLDDSTQPNYTSVSATGNATIRARFDPKGYIRPFQKCLVVDVEEWALAEGDIITVIYGDTSGGSPGTQVQTFREFEFCFKVAVDCFGTGQFVELEDPPKIEIVPGPAEKLVVIGPSRARCGETFAVGVRAEDRWGNPAVGYRGELELENATDFDGLPSRYTLQSDDEGVVRFGGVRCLDEGVFRLRVRSGEGLAAEANPLVVRAAADELQPLWGDLHGQSQETVGTNSIDAYFRFARDTALLDFSGHQGNDFQITPEFWAEINRCARQYNAPGSFVVFPGYEWSATTPAGGDRNVYYLDEDEPIYRTSHWQVEAKTDVENDRYPVGELFAALRGKRALVVPHIGGRPANLAFHDPELEPVIEIYSAWGQFEWLLEEAIQRGYKVGIVAGSDDHKGRPGASYPGSSSFGVYGGLTCVWAKEWSRAGIWEALKARRCYGTSGQRILLDVRAQGRPMGEEFCADGPVSFAVEAVGTAPIEEIIVRRGNETVYRFPEQLQRDRGRVRVTWGGARIKGRARIARWDGQVLVEKGRITAAETYAFDSAAEGIQSWDGGQVRFKSVTSGDEDGLILDIEGNDQTQLRFSSPIAELEVELGQLEQGPVQVDAGGVGLMVRAEYLPLGLASCQAEFTWVESQIPQQCTPYYVRLTQSDGGRAWSSPFYISTANAAG